jgi:hypothetical protein
VQVLCRVLPTGYPNPHSLRTRQRTWERDGTLARLLEVGQPAIERMRDDYFRLVRAASDFGSADWKSSSEFFDRGAIPRLTHAEPKGRYAWRQRKPAST